jgi:hypothetical protein
MTWEPKNRNDDDDDDDCGSGRSDDESSSPVHGNKQHQSGTNKKMKHSKIDKGITSNYCLGLIINGNTVTG